MWKRTRRMMLGVILVLAAACLLGGCGKKEEGRSSKGVEDGVEGFLFNFDQRDEVTKLVEERNKGNYPKSVTWYYKKDKKDKNNTRNSDNKSKKDKQIDINELAVTSTDGEKIREIYFALSNTIVLGVDANHSEKINFFISFELQDGTECRFDFVGETTIRLSEHNYVAEPDGSLWTSLAEEQEQIEAERTTEAAETTEAVETTEAAVETTEAAVETTEAASAETTEEALAGTTEAAAEAETESASEEMTENALEESTETASEGTTEAPAEETTEELRRRQQKSRGQ